MELSRDLVVIEGRLPEWGVLSRPSCSAFVTSFEAVEVVIQGKITFRRLGIGKTVERIEDYLSCPHVASGPIDGMTVEDC